jgi:nitrogen regulatory protein PII
MRQGGVNKGSFIYSGEDRRIASDLVPKVKLEVVTPDSQMDSVIEAITESAKTEEGEHGDGVIFVFREKK